jgi:hypothetical protein
MSFAFASAAARASLQRQRPTPAPARVPPRVFHDMRAGADLTEDHVREYERATTPRPPPPVVSAQHRGNKQKDDVSDDLRQYERTLPSTRATGWHVLHQETAAVSQPPTAPPDDEHEEEARVSSSSAQEPLAAQMVVLTVSTQRRCCNVFEALQLVTMNYDRQFVSDDLYEQTGMTKATWLLQRNVERLKMAVGKLPQYSQNKIAPYVTSWIDVVSVEIVQHMTMTNNNRLEFVEKGSLSLEAVFSLVQETEQKTTNSGGTTGEMNRYEEGFVEAFARLLQNITQNQIPNDAQFKEMVRRNVIALLRNVYQLQFNMPPKIRVDRHSFGAFLLSQRAVSNYVKQMWPVTQTLQGVSR